MMRVLILSVALISGGAASYLSMRATPPEMDTGLANTGRMDEILVVTRQIDVGDALQKRDLAWQPWPSNAISPGLVVKSAAPQALEEYAGTTSRSIFYAGEPIRGEKLVGREDDLMSLTLPYGKRAIAVKISTGNTASGFISPNDRVDVIHTTLMRDLRDRSSSRTVLSNIRVLAIDQGGDVGVTSAKTATLELDPRQVEVISAAEASGLISLALRPLSEKEDTEIPDIAKRQRIQIIRSGRLSVVGNIGKES